MRVRKRKIEPGMGMAQSIEALGLDRDWPLPGFSKPPASPATDSGESPGLRCS